MCFYQTLLKVYLKHIFIQNKILSCFEIWIITSAQKNIFDWLVLITSLVVTTSLVKVNVTARTRRGLLWLDRGTNLPSVPPNSNWNVYVNYLNTFLFVTLLYDIALSWWIAFTDKYIICLINNRKWYSIYNIATLDSQINISNPILHYNLAMTIYLLIPDGYLFVCKLLFFSAGQLAITEQNRQYILFILFKCIITNTMRYNQP